MNERDMSRKSYFFAYAGSPPLNAETMREAAKICGNSGATAKTWQDLDIQGRIIIGEILEEIDNADACVAEVGSCNANVLFEAGYALAKGKTLFLAIDESDGDAIRSWRDLSIVDTIGRTDYRGNSGVLADKVLSSKAFHGDSLVDTLLAGASAREPNAVFAPPALSQFTSAERLEHFLDRQTHLKILGAHEEVGLASLRYYVGQVYRSSAAIFHFAKPARTRASVYNGRLAFVAGVACGFEIPVLMVAEDGYISPLDYRDLLYTYDSSHTLTERVGDWLSKIPSPGGSNRRLGRLKLDIELPIRTFGQPVAEAEQEELAEYFVHTNEFEAILNARADVFTGRKGTGKTATMYQVAAELRKDRRVLVVPVKPSSYDLASLTMVLKGLGNPGTRDYFLISVWSFLLTSELAIAALNEADGRPAGIGSDDPTSALAEVVEKLGIDRQADLSTRLDDVINEASSDADDVFDGKNAAAKLRTIWQQQLVPALRPVLRRYSRVAVLIDNLDKTWERGVDFENLSWFLLALFVCTGKLKSEFGRSRKGQPSCQLTFGIFLRSDIYRVLAGYAREPDKINPQSILWQDEELLIRVLEERYTANRSGAIRSRGSLWSEVFDGEVLGLSTRDFFLWRALPRPRDIIFLGNAALTTAIDRRHEKVLSQDFLHAQKIYSQFAVEALIVESEAQGFDLESILFEFAGLSATLDENVFDCALSAVEDIDSVRMWLICTSFLGLETSSGRFEYVEGESEAKRKLISARRMTERMGRPLNFRIHPAFRPYLEVADDDIHQS